MNKIVDKSAQVLIADPGASTRLSMVSVVRALGFTNTVAVSSLAEATPSLQKGTVDWLITSAFLGDTANVLQVLEAARTHAPLRNLFVSLCVAESEHHIVPRAFTLGLLSCHRKPFGKDEFTAFIENLHAALAADSPNAALVAAQYFRSHLRSKLAYETLLEFETTLVRAFADKPSLLLHLAEVNFEMGEDQRARALLWQAEERDQSLAARARALGAEYIGTVKDRQWQSLKPGVCAVVDSDGAVLKMAQSALESCTAKAVHAFADGEAFWHWLEGSTPPDIIVMEWRVPKVSGPKLLQRLRAKGLHLPLVIIFSSLVKKKDSPILEEMGATTVLEKPAGLSDFLNCLAAVIDRTRKPSDQDALERRMHALLAGGAVEEAAKHMQIYVQKVEAQDPRRKHLEAEFAFQLGDFVEARNLAMASLALGSKSVVTLNLLGKTLMRLREFEAALKIFARASEISPDSIERLCAIAETQNELGDAITAKSTLAKAAAADAENEIVVKTSFNLALATGDAALAQEMITKLPASHNVLAYVNNSAVAFAKTQKLKESIALYRNALKAIPSGRPDLNAVVFYNLALAQIQANDLPGAVASLKSAGHGIADKKLAVKIGSLQRRTEEAVKTGRPLKLNKAAIPPRPRSLNNSFLWRRFRHP